VKGGIEVREGEGEGEGEGSARQPIEQEEEEGESEDWSWGRRTCGKCFEMVYRVRDESVGREEEDEIESMRDRGEVEVRVVVVHSDRPGSCCVTLLGCIRNMSRVGRDAEERRGRRRRLVNYYIIDSISRSQRDEPPPTRDR
jgi:hypothetical protein